MKILSMLPKLTVMVLAGMMSLSASAADDLSQGFRTPPDSAKPHTWWHWMNGNVTREGITADLEAMKRIGLGGAQIFNVSEDIPAGPVIYNSSEWRALVKHAAAEADRLGLELCIHNCAGWSSSGGPWVAPEYAMQTVVVSEEHAQGPARFAKPLAQPKSRSDYYRDIVVLAFPTPKDDVTRIKDFRAKALYEYRYGLEPSPDATPAAASIDPTAIIDISAHFKDGQLTWDVPSGDWTILRIGHTPTGAVNAPAPVSGRGLEVDKLSREAFDQYWAGGMAPLIKELGPLAGKSLKNVLVDSYEVGCQNWTPRFRDEFTRRRGYDPLKFLPAMTGRIVKSGEASERFLWDLRRTVGDLFADNYYTYFAETCRKNGLLASIEPYDGPFECSQVARDADIVMGEFWVTGGMRSSCKLAASVAHVFGKTIVGAESFTAEPRAGGWRNHPASLKAVGDLMYAEGINRCIIHRYAHQPWLNIEPGMTMGQWGTHFERTTTWWDHGGPEWIAYLARCQFLLQRGQFAADVLFFAGDAAPNGAPHEPALKAKGYDYDTCGMDALQKASVRNGSVVLASGMSYRVLVIPDSALLNAASRKLVDSLAREGAVVQTQSHGRWKLSDAEGISRATGTDATGLTVDQALAAMKIAPDVTFRTNGGAAPSIAWIHRVDGDADLYFLSNQKPRSVSVECSFRISGKSPEFWNAETGVIEPAPSWRVEDGRTLVTARLEATGSVFVVFRPGTAQSHVVAVQMPKTPAAHVPTIVIGKARYEAVDGTGSTDVTAKVAELAAAGVTEIPAGNDLFGDPAYNHIKRLHAEYTVDGVQVVRDTQENGVLVLVEPGPESSADFELATAPGGGIDLLAFKPGTYEVRLSDETNHRIEVATVAAAIEVAGPWKVSFQQGRGAPATASFDTLSSWSASQDPGIKYFSGTATYEKDFELPKDYVGSDAGNSSSPALMLDLGSVHEVAECTLNGTMLPTLWKAPFRVNITDAARAGHNHLTLKVTNLWMNRLIGDEQLPEDTQWARAVPTPLKAWPEWFASGASSANATLAGRPSKDRLTFTTWKHWQKDSPLMESGLIGPVLVRAAERRHVTGKN